MAEGRHGTQTIERTVLVLRALAARGGIGWRLSDLATRCALDRGTTHRILACLVRERLARQRASDRRYVPGPLLFELGLSLPALAEFQSVCSAPLTRLANQLGGVALLYLRSGSEFVCAGRAGTLQLKALTIDVGTRRPLITSVAGAAMLTALPRSQARKIIAENVVQLRRFGAARVRALRDMVRESEGRGYGISQDGIVSGVSAFAVAVLDANQNPFAAVSIVGPSDSFPSAVVADVIVLLELEADAIRREAIRLLGSSN